MATACGSLQQLRNKMVISSSPNSSGSGIFPPRWSGGIDPKSERLEEGFLGDAPYSGGENIDLCMLMSSQEEPSSQSTVQQATKLALWMQYLPSQIILMEAKLGKRSEYSEGSVTRLLQSSISPPFGIMIRKNPLQWSRAPLFRSAKLWEKSPNSSVTEAGSDEPFSDTAVRMLLPHLLSETPRRRNKIREFILRISDPRSLSRVFFQEYERTCKSELLLHVRSMLEDYGDSAWPALKEIANSRREECELFVGPIARFGKAPEMERLEALRALSLNPSKFVRSSVLEHIGCFSGETARSILRILNQDPDPDVRDEAGERLRAAR